MITFMQPFLYFPMKQWQPAFVNFVIPNVFYLYSDFFRHVPVSTNEIGFLKRQPDNYFL